MNPEQALSLVVKAIDSRPYDKGFSFALCVKGETVLCVPSNSFRDDGNCLGYFSESDFQQGLSRNQWLRIQKNLVEFCERKRICLECLKS